MALERTFTLDLVKQEYSTSGVVTRQGEFGETIVFRLFAGGANYVLSPTVDRVKLKGITNDNKYIELDGTIQVTRSNTNAKVVLTKDWNSASGAFKVVYLEVKKSSTAQTSTVNLDWFVLPEANVTDKDVAHYVDELQEIIDRMEATAESYLQQLTDKLAQANAELDTLRNNINTADANLSSKITALEARLNTEIAELEAKIAKAQQDLETLVSGYESRVAQALADFENGNFYTKPEADATFMKKGEIPDTIQKFKLTADDGQPLPVPSDITSFNDLAKLTGYFYVPRATAITYTDQNSLPINFRNAGLFVSMPVGQPVNAYRYQEIKLNSTTFARMAYRNTNGVSSTPWVEVANEASVTRIDDTVSDQGRRIATNTMNIATNTTNIDTLQQHDKIYVYKEKSLPNYGKNWAGVDATQCRIEFKRVGNRVTMNLRINVSDSSKFLGDGGGTMDRIYEIPVGFRMEASVPYYNTPITTGQWAFSHTAPLNYSGIVEQTGFVRWTTAKTGNHYLTATYFTEDPFPTEGVLGAGQVKIMTQNPDGSIEFGGDWA